MNFDALKTLTGLTLAELAAKLDEQLPADAYKAVPGGADLTDIDPNYMNRMLNEVFGLCGIGWGYDYNPDAIELRSGEKRMFATVSKLTLWYKLTDGEVMHVFEVQATGGNDNSVMQYAMKGAITNAIGNAVSKIGFQESVYLGKRDHRTVKSGKPVQSKPALSKAEGPAGTNGAKPAPAPAPTTEKAEEAAPAPAPRSNGDPGAVVVHIGSFKGQTVGDLPVKNLAFFAKAESFSPRNENDKALQAACSALLAARKN